jgi:hypothetical protein
VAKPPLSVAVNKLLPRVVGSVRSYVLVLLQPADLEQTRAALKKLEAAVFENYNPKVTSSLGISAAL